MSGIYEYQLPGRRPATLAALAATGGLFAVAMIHDAPGIVRAIWAAAGGALLWAVLANPVSGCRIDGTRFVWFTPRAEAGVLPSRIAGVHLTTWSEGPDTCTIRLCDGEALSPPSLCLPPGETLRRVLVAHGVPVTRS